MRDNKTFARLIAVAGGLRLESSYDPGFIAALKAQIPAESRRWDSANKCWLIDPSYGSVCAELAVQYLGVPMTVPDQSRLQEPTTVRTVKLEYLGQCKSRNGDEPTAFGWADGGWTLIFPESVLREWFEAVPQAPGEKPTLYAVLGIKHDASLDNIRTAFRRLARQWHPDMCAEPDAAEQFKVINRAYEVLSDQRLRQKYDAGLALEASLTTEKTYRQSSPPYRAPLRCGWVMGEGTQTLDRFKFSKILRWEDVINEQGQVMVTTWPKGDDHFYVIWR